MAPIGNRVSSSEAFGAAIRDRRRRLGLTQQQVADTIGVARRVVGELERGKGSVRLEIAISAARAVGLNLIVEQR